MLKTILNDVISGTSHCVDFLDSENSNCPTTETGIALRKFFSPLLRKIYLTQTKYRLVIDKREKLPAFENGYIFVMNHRQADDIVLGANVVNHSAYVVFGNAKLALETSNGLGLWAYGMILLNRSRKTNRHAAYDKMKYVLEHGGNIWIFPEGYWNLADTGEADAQHGADGHCSACWLVQDMNIGCFRLAQETGAKLVPCVMHYDETHGKRYYAQRGAPVPVSKTDDVFEVKSAFLNKCRQ